VIRLWCWIVTVISFLPLSTHRWKYGCVSDCVERYLGIPDSDIVTELHTAVCLERSLCCSLFCWKLVTDWHTSLWVVRFVSENVRYHAADGSMASVLLISLDGHF